MKAKEYLSRAKKLDTQIKADLRGLEHWKELSVSISGGGYDPHYNASKSVEAPFVKCMEKIAELEKKIKRENNELMLLKMDMLEKLHSIENADYQSVLELRYLGYRTWEQIAEEMDYSIRWVYKLHGKALQEMEQKLKEDSRVQLSSW